MAKKCSKCGERLFPTDTFCGFCGEPVGNQVEGVDKKIYTPKPIVGEGSITQLERKQLDKARRVLASNPDVIKAEVERREKEAAERAAAKRAEEEQKKAGEDKAREEAEKQAAEKKAREEAEKQAAEKKAREEAEKLAAEKMAREEAEKIAEEQKAREEAEKARIEAERKASEKERAELEKLAAEKKTREELEKKAAEKMAREDAEKIAAEQKVREEAEKARIEAERIASEKERAELEKLAAEKMAREEVRSLTEDSQDDVDSLAAAMKAQGANVAEKDKETLSKSDEKAKEEAEAEKIAAEINPKAESSLAEDEFEIENGPEFETEDEFSIETENGNSSYGDAGAGLNAEQTADTIEAQNSEKSANENAEDSAKYQDSENAAESADNAESQSSENSEENAADSVLTYEKITEGVADIDEEARIARENAERAAAESREAERAVALAKAQAEEYRRSIGYQEPTDDLDFDKVEGEIVEGDGAGPDDGDDDYDVVLRTSSQPEKSKRIRDIILLLCGIAVLAFVLSKLLKDDVKERKGNDAYHNDNVATAEVSGSPTPTPTNSPTPTPTSTPTPTPIPYAPSDLETAWDGSVAEMLSKGVGSEEDPFLIRCGSELAFVAHEVNRGVNFENIYFSLENDIDLSDMEWTPIGYYSADPELGDLVYSFCGIFAGNDHKISNFHIETLEAAKNLPSYSTNITIGLFGAVSGAKIDNLVIENARINTGTESGEVLAGLFSGYTGSSTLSNISVSGDVTISGKARVAAGIALGAVSEVEITDSSANGAIVVTNDNGVIDEGIFAGYAVSSKFAKLTVNGSANSTTNGNTYLGGISGYSSAAEFSESTVTAALTAKASTTESFIMAGGIAGANYSGSDEKCSVDTTITANGVQDMYTGGAYGYLEGAKSSELTAKANMTVIDTGEFATLMAGGIIGYVSGSELNGTKVEGTITTNSLTKNYVGGMLGSGSDNTISNFTSAVNLDATARGVTKSDIRAGGIAGNNVGSVYNSITITGNVKINSGVNGYVGGAFGYIRDGEYNNVTASGQLNNKSRTGVATGGIAGYASGNSVMNSCTGTAKRTNSGKNVYDNDIIGIKAE